MNTSAVEAELINLSIDLPVIKIMKGKQHWFDIPGMSLRYYISWIKRCKCKHKKRIQF